MLIFLSYTLHYGEGGESMWTHVEGEKNRRVVLANTPNAV